MIQNLHEYYNVCREKNRLCKEIEEYEKTHDSNGIEYKPIKYSRLIKLSRYYNDLHGLECMKHLEDAVWEEFTEDERHTGFHILGTPGAYDEGDFLNHHQIKDFFKSIIIDDEKS